MATLAHCGVDIRALLIDPTALRQPPPVPHLHLLLIQEGTRWTDMGGIVVLEGDDNRFSKSSGVQLVNTRSIPWALDSDRWYDDAVYFKFRTWLLRVPLTVSTNNNI